MNKEEITHNSKPQKNNIWKTIILFIWFIASVAALIILAAVRSEYIIVIFGQYFFVFGILTLSQGKDTKEIGTILLGIGLACIIIPILTLNTNIISITNNHEKLLVLSTLAIFIIVGFLMIYRPGIKHLKNKLKYNTGVTGKVTKITEHPLKNKKTYSITYQYEYRGKEYLGVKNIRSKKQPLEIGDLEELFINPQEPNKIYTERYTDKFIFRFGIIFFIISSLFFLIYILSLYRII